jgi:hypothetical protein
VCALPENRGSRVRHPELYLRHVLAHHPVNRIHERIAVNRNAFLKAAAKIPSSESQRFNVRYCTLELLA